MDELISSSAHEISIFVRLDQPEVVPTEVVEGIACYDVAFVCRLLNRKSHLLPSSSEGPVPYPVSGGVRLDQPEVVPTKVVEGIACYDVAAVDCLLDRMPLLLSGSSEGSLPFAVPE